MLEPGQLEAIRMLTNHDLDSACPLACLLIGQPTLRRRIKLGILAAAVISSPSPQSLAGQDILRCGHVAEQRSRRGR